MSSAGRLAIDLGSRADPVCARPTSAARYSTALGKIARRGGAHDPADRVAVRRTRKAMPKPLVLNHVEARRSFLVERTEPFEFTGTAGRHFSMCGPISPA